MLGERRSNSLFALAAPAEPERKPEQAEVHDISFEERTGRSLFAEAATAPRASELFFAPQEKGVTFAEALSQVQSYLSETYATLITEDNSDAKEQMKRRMARYLQENRIAVDGMTASELVDALYTEMAEYGFLTKYIFADGIEEIDINSWRDIEIQYSDGHTAKLEEHFDSPEHAANVIRRMLQNSGKVLDNASPIITSRLAKNIRISVIKTPVLDEDAGVAASIRIVNPRNLSKGTSCRVARPQRKCWTFCPPACAMAFLSAWREQLPPARPPWRAGSSPPSRTASASLPLKMDQGNSNLFVSVTAG